jgi:UDP-N-acetylmuramyl tripeptide synthase
MARTPTASQDDAPLAAQAAASAPDADRAPAAAPAPAPAPDQPAADPALAADLPVALVARRRPPRLTPRLFTALVAARAAGTTSRLLGRGGGTSLPGMVARRVDPDILGTIVGGRGVPVVAITGSNGKTTTARFTAAILRGEGVGVAHNSSGSNLVQGVTTLAVGFADLRGGLPYGALVAEVDEGALLVVADELRPRALVIVDLFRDQLDRFGELHALGEALDGVASRLPADRALVVNADDPLVASLAPDREGRRVTFGFDVGASLDRITRAADTIRCPRCRHELAYRTVHLSHMGDWSCAGCGFARPDLDVAVTAVEVTGLDETRCTIRLPDEATIDLAIPQAGIHVAYDAAAAIATVIALDVPVTHAAASLAGIRPAFGRIETIGLPDGRSVVLAFSKNPTSFNTTFRALASEGEPRHLLVAASNTLVDGEDFAWLWDVDVESVAPRILDVVVSGTRADELATRLKYAGVDPARMTVVEDRPAALDAALANVPPDDRLTVVAGYTPTIELREEMHRRGWTGRFWEQ